MIYPIVIYGAEVLRSPAGEADREEVTPAFVQDMFETLYASEGVGLAAPQIGKDMRLFVVDLTHYADEHPELADFKKVFVNPEIYWHSEETCSSEEGCLSVPGIHENVSRPTTVRIRYLDAEWNEHDEEWTGYPARVIQHEYDHLEGIVFTERLAPIRKTLLKSKLSAMTKGKYSASYKTKLIR